jgi:hypothetical protein
VSDCPIVVLLGHGVNVNRLRRHDCHLCRKSLFDHPFDVSRLVPPGTAWRVNPKLVGTLGLRG